MKPVMDFGPIHGNAFMLAAVIAALVQGTITNTNYTLTGILQLSISIIILSVRRSYSRVLFNLKMESKV